MNILILSCGTRNKLVEFFKEEQSGFDKVIATDCSKYAPALYAADQYYLVPPMEDDDYLDCILDICKKEDIKAVLPLREDELTFLSGNKQVFISMGITPVVSSSEAVEICRDKFTFYQYLCKQGLPSLKTYDDLLSFNSDYQAGKIQFPVFVKPTKGCGSLSIHKARDMEELDFLYTHSEEDILIQEFADGEEYGADIYVDLYSRKVVSVFVKKKLRMRAGETEKSISVKDPDLFKLIERTVSALELFGPIDMDIFKVNGAYYISEINPRFGGGYPHAHACGISFPKLLADNAAGRENMCRIGNYRQDVCYLKYSEGISITL